MEFQRVCSVCLLKRKTHNCDKEKEKNLVDLLNCFQRHSCKIWNPSTNPIRIIIFIWIFKKLHTKKLRRSAQHNFKLFWIDIFNWRVESLKLQNDIQQWRGCHCCKFIIEMVIYRCFNRQSKQVKQISIYLLRIAHKQIRP